MEREFHASWGKPLRVLSALSLGILMLIVILGLATGPRHLWIWRVAMIGAPLFVAIAALPFMVRGYTLTGGSLVVHRLGFDTTLPLDDLRSVRGVAGDVAGAVRLFGNGGLFSITGWFWNRRLGRYRAYATDFDRAVLLEFGRRKVVVTPHDPQAFIAQVRRQFALR